METNQNSGFELEKSMESLGPSFPVLEGMLAAVTFFYSIINKFLCPQVGISYSS